MSLIIGIVHWKIKIECRDEFVKNWKSKFKIGNKDVLFGEFLSELNDEMRVTLATWNISCSDLDNDKRCAHFINVGFWRSIEDFDEQTNGYKADEAPLAEYEVERRQRFFVKPIAHRSGALQIPAELSNEVA